MDGYDSPDFPDQNDWGGECGVDYDTDPQQHPAAPTGRPAVPYIAEHYNYLESLYPTGRPAVPYIAEHYNYLESLYSSDYRPYLISRINASHLSPGAKRAFVSTIRNFFSHTALLSYQRDAEIAEIDLDIALNLLALSCNKVDINLPEYPHLIELIRAHFNRFIVSRTLGVERERILQNRTTYESVSKITNEEEKKRAKRGLGIIGRVFGGGDN